MVHQIISNIITSNHYDLRIWPAIILYLEDVLVSTVIIYNSRVSKKQMKAQ